jgi:hypothetical protein
MSRWSLLKHTSPSGKILYGCAFCRRESCTADKRCPAGCEAHEPGPREPTIPWSDGEHGAVDGPQEVEMGDESELRHAVEAFATSVDEAVEFWSAPRGGQHVPFRGDWACAVPSVQQRLVWWARILRQAAARESRR